MFRVLSDREALKIREEIENVALLPDGSGYKSTYELFQELRPLLEEGSVFGGTGTASKAQYFLAQEIAQRVRSKRPFTNEELKGFSGGWQLR